MNGRCCVFQPFDKGPFDKRYDDTLAPAIKEAGLEPYRVDRDDGAAIPIETLHEQIRLATICLADIGAQNPNVMYELGFAIASGKDVVIICSGPFSERFPFDIQHRGIIVYASDSASDFERLRNGITARIKALLRKQETRQEIASASPVRSTEGLQPHEIAALALIMANVDSSTDSVATYTLKQDMDRAGYTRVASQLAITRLCRMGLIEAFEASDFNHNDYIAYRVLPEGEDWLLTNQDKLEMRAPPGQQRTADEPGITDDDVPF